MQSTDLKELVNQLCDTVDELTKDITKLRDRVSDLEAGTKKNPVPAAPKPWRIEEEQGGGNWLLDQVGKGPVTRIPSPDDLLAGIVRKPNA